MEWHPLLLGVDFLLEGLDKSSPNEILPDRYLGSLLNSAYVMTHHVTLPLNITFCYMV